MNSETCQPFSGILFSHNCCFDLENQKLKVSRNSSFEMYKFRNLALVGAVLLLYSETMQEARTIFAGVPSMGDEPKGKVSHS